MVSPTATGQRRGGEPANEADHFQVCPDCGQAFDRRDWRLVFHHLKAGHEPLPADA